MTITADTLVSTLLSTAYERFDEPDQSRRDAFLANAGARILAELTSGHQAPATILAGLRRGIDERRLLIYSTDNVEEADLAQTDTAGILNIDPRVPTIGVFLNDGTGAKLDYYLSNEVQVSPV